MTPREQKGMEKLKCVFYGQNILCCYSISLAVKDHIFVIRKIRLSLLESVQFESVFPANFVQNICRPLCAVILKNHNRHQSRGLQLIMLVAPQIC